MKATRWWDSRFNLPDETKSISSLCPGKRKRVMLKAISGRGRRRADWVTYLYAELESEFRRLKAAGVKFSPALLGQLARSIVDDAPVFNSDYIDPCTQHPLKNKITTRWIQQLIV